MNTEHGAEDVKTFSKGINADAEKELLGAQNTGEYLSARNARPVSVGGNTGSIEKIKGEQQVFSNANLSQDYICIGSVSVRDNQVEFWASPILGQQDAIRVNGTVMVLSDDLQFEVDRNIRSDSNDECEGGEFFITDNFFVPLIFNLKDIVDSFQANSQKYFTEFNRKLYEINLSTPVDKPVFKRLVPIGGGAGLPVGQYSYAIRYVSTAGDRTNISPKTPLIPVVSRLSTDSNAYPGSKTSGAISNLDAPSPYGIELRFRITNIFNYDSIEVIRYSWAAGSALNFTPSAEIIGRVDISGIKIDTFTFTDPINSNLSETIPIDQETNQLAFIERAKDVRYFDRRLVLFNYGVASREFSPTFIQRSGVEMFPIMDKLGRLGHNDPYNHTYRKSYMSGEKYGFAINAFDGVSAKAFAIPVPNFTSYTFPNRRDVITNGSDSDIYSTGTVEAANVNGTVTKTFEVFDTDDATGKTDICSFKNVFFNPGAVVTSGTKSLGDVTQDCTDDPEIYGGEKVLAGARVQAPYSPYRPIGDNDNVVSGHNYRINTYVNDGSSDIEYNPEIFGLNYYAKAIALNGLENIPDWVKSFTVVRTKRADRVVCQGLAMYKINEADFNLVGNASLAGKERDKFWFYSPDIDQGIASESLIRSIKENPQNFKIQFVSPLGFASELYNFEQDSIQGRDSLCDLMVYARVLKDGLGTGKLINPTESGIGQAGRVAYNKYRNSESVNGGFFSAPDGGNRLAQLRSFEQVSEGRGTYFELATNELIYNTSFTGGSNDNDFEDQGLKDWTEPFYIVNIIQEGVEIVDQNINSYLDTGAYVKMESIIGSTDSVVVNPEFDLIDERWEDCIPDLSSTGAFAGQDRFVYFRDDNETALSDKAWLNVTYKTAGQITTIINDISINGFHLTSGGVEVYGVYRHIVVSDREQKIVFDVTGFNQLAQNKFIIVKYNEEAPIKIFGGDVTVGETIFAPIDSETNLDDTLNLFGFNLNPVTGRARNSRGFQFNVGFPFRKYFVTPRHYIIKNSKSSVSGDRIQNSRNIANQRVLGTLAYIRQMCVMFTVESRISTHYAFNSSFPNEFFPNTHYIIRPNLYSRDKFSEGATEVYEDNLIHPRYEDDYGDEFLLWGYGGIRFKQSFNRDYSQEPLTDFVSKPQFGFVEKTDFCTGVIWSLSRAINQMDSPGLKSFNTLNTVLLDDRQGEIKIGFDANTSKGSNIYAIAEKGVCLLLHKKSVLTSASGDDLGLFKGNNFIQQEIWIDRNIGISDEMWRASAEGTFGFVSENGSMIRVESLVFVNNNSVYQLIDNGLKDIGRDGLYSDFVKVLPLSINGQQGKMASYYDIKNNEYVFMLEHIDPNNPTNISLIKAFAYSFTNQTWISNYDYRFDNFLLNKNTVFGMRQGETYELDNGNLINGLPIIFEVEQASSVLPQKEKEFIKVNINSDNKPTRVEFSDSQGNFLCALDESIQGQLYLKKYDGWTQQIPRKDLTVSANRDRVQGRLLVYKIIHNLDDDFTLKTVFTTFKPIK